MEQNLVLEAFKFMMLGMGVVFSFLVILIFVLKAQGALLTSFSLSQRNNLSKRCQHRLLHLILQKK
jgi:oxaloacetate decarboxylase gamma subunit